MPERTFSYYQIDPASLDVNDTVLYLHLTTDPVVAPNDDEFVPYNTNLLPTLAHVPDWTKQYYAEQYASGQKPLRFLGIPHILHRGTIDTTNLPIITV
jgi:hypothetical protein